MNKLLYRAGLFWVSSLIAGAAFAQPVDSGRGIDPSVDYQSLLGYAPWDDRNYQLTANELEILAPRATKFNWKTVLPPQK